MENRNKFKQFRFGNLKNIIIRKGFNKFLNAPYFLKQYLLDLLSSRINHLYSKLIFRLKPLENKIIIYKPTFSEKFLKMTILNGKIRIKIGTANDVKNADVKISCEIIDLLKLSEGEVDGDALFFSRNIVIEGNAEILVLLRNALENEGLEFRNIISPKNAIFAASINRIIIEIDTRLGKFDQFFDDNFNFRIDNLETDMSTFFTDLERTNRRIEKLEGRIARG